MNKMIAGIFSELKPIQKLPYLQVANSNFVKIQCSNGFEISNIFDFNNAAGPKGAGNIGQKNEKGANKRKVCDENNTGSYV